MAHLHGDRKHFKIGPGDIERPTHEFKELIKSLHSAGYSFAKGILDGDGKVRYSVWGLHIDVPKKRVTANYSRWSFREFPAKQVTPAMMRRILYNRARVMPEVVSEQLDLPVDDLKEKPTIVNPAEIVPDLFLILQGQHQWFKTTKQEALAFATNKAAQHPQNPVKICEVHVVGTVTSEIKINFNTSS